MSKIEEKALELFENSHNCSQSVLSALSSRLDITHKQAVSLAAGFGAGICFQGQTCGAVTGAYMALGLQSGSLFDDGESIKENTYQYIRKYNDEFENLHGTTNCAKLLGIDISTESGVQEATDMGVFKTKCPEFIRSSVSICKELLRIDE